MSKVIEFFKDYSAGMYLGISLFWFTGIDYSDWQWWAVAMPTIFLVVWRGRGRV